MTHSIVVVSRSLRELYDQLRTAPVIITVEGPIVFGEAKTFHFNVPNDSSLLDQSICLQALDFSGSNHHLTNSVDAYIR